MVNAATGDPTAEQYWKKFRDLRAVFDSIGHVIWLLDAESRIVTANRATEAFLGRPVREAVGRHCWELVHGTDLPLPGCPVTSMFQSGRRESLELQIGGNWYQIDADPIFDEEGRVGGAVHIIADIGPRKQAEQALREIEERFRLITDNAHDMISLHDLSGKYVYASPAARAITGYEPDELVGRSAFEFVPKEDWAALGAHHQRTIESGPQAPIEFRVRRKDGRQLWVEGVSRVISGAGEQGRLMVVLRDIEERKKAEDQLLASEGKLRAIIQSAPLGVHLYRLEQDGRLVLEGANPAADRILKIDHQPLLGLTIEQAFPPLAATDIPDRYRLAGRDGVPYCSEQVDYADERSISGAFEVHAFRTSPGHVAVMFHDITERKRVEREHQLLQEQLQQAQKMESIGRLAGGVAHDFNNLLSPILGYAEMLSMELTDGSRQKDQAGLILQAAQRAKELTQQLLTFSRKQVLQLRSLDLGAVVRDFERLLRRTIREDIRLDTRAPAATRLPVLADEGQLQQLLMNLAVNAQDAMPGGGDLLVEVGRVGLEDAFVSENPGAAARAYAWLCVSDTGCGMDPQTVERMFEPFFTTKEMGRGTGLGMSIAYGIVRQHNGHISVSSQPGIGTSIRVFLPLQDDPTE